MTSTADRIVRALKKGRLFEGMLRMIVGDPRDFCDVLRSLQRRQVIERDPDYPQTWRLFGGR